MSKSLREQLDELDRKAQLQGIDYAGLSRLLRDIIDRIEPTADQKMARAQAEGLNRRTESSSSLEIAQANSHPDLSDLDIEIQRLHKQREIERLQVMRKAGARIRSEEA